MMAKGEFACGRGVFITKTCEYPRSVPNLEERGFKVTGVLPPEQCIERVPFFKGLARRGIKVTAVKQTREEFGGREIT